MKNPVHTGSTKLEERKSLIPRKIAIVQLAAVNRLFTVSMWILSLLTLFLFSKEQAKNAAVRMTHTFGESFASNNYMF